MASGKFSLRIPPQLHEELVKQAEDEGVSLNLYCNFLLTAGVASGKVLEQIWDKDVKVVEIQV
jgi:hypothetical protein